MIIDYQYEYWGDNGRCYESKLEEYDSEREAISDLGFTADYNAIEGTMKINRVLGGEEGAVERITTAIAEYIAKMARVAEITKLKRSIAGNEHWFANREAETEKRSLSMFNARARLVELRADED